MANLFCTNVIINIILDLPMNSLETGSSILQKLDIKSTKGKDSTR